MDFTEQAFGMTDLVVDLRRTTVREAAQNWMRAIEWEALIRDDRDTVDLESQHPYC